MKKLMTIAAVAAFALTVNAAPVINTQHADDTTTLLPGAAAQGDLIEGLVEGAGMTVGALDIGWHSANNGGNPGNGLDGYGGFTDGAGPAGGLSGLLNDFGDGNANNLPAKHVIYDLGEVKDIGEIQMFGGNFGKDGRVFLTSVINTSVDGTNFDNLGYFQSDPSGTLNSGTWVETLMEITDTTGTLASARYVEFLIYPADNGGGQCRDPFDGVNPYTGVDDTLTAGFVSPLIWELDVIEVPEPGTMALLALGGLALIRRR